MGSVFESLSGAWGAVKSVAKSFSLTGSSGPLPSWPANWWQYSSTPSQDADYKTFGPVQTCVNIISQDISRLPMNHIQVSPAGARVRIDTKAPARVFRKPNKFQTRSDWLLYKMRSLLMDGNAYSVAKRNDRFEVVEMYPLPPWSVYPYVVPTGNDISEEDAGSIIYHVSHSQMVDIAQPDVDDGWWIPARDMLHVRLQTPHSPLIGESPLVAAKYPTITGTEINKHAASFFSNMARPGGILRHPGQLSEEAMSRIKQKWDEIAAGSKTGSTAVIAEGMEFQQLQMTAVDAELAAIYALSERQVFQVFRVPSFLGGDLADASLNNVESLTRFYLQSCLGFYVDHLEEAFTLFFGLPKDEFILFDLDRALLAGDLRERMEALGKGVQNGIYAPNEARARENLPPVEDGDQPRVQQQLVPLSFGMNLTPPSPAGGSPAAGPSESDSDDDEMDPDVERAMVHMFSEQLRKQAIQ